MAQMSLSPKMKSNYIRQALFQGLSHAQHNRDIPSDHLYVRKLPTLVFFFFKTANFTKKIEEAYVTRGPYRKKLDIKGRGRQGIMFKPCSHFYLTLVNDPEHRTKEQKKKDKIMNFLGNTTIKYYKIRAFP